MRLTQKGQVTVPKDIRDRLGLMPNSEVEFVVRGKEVLLRKADKRSGRGTRIVNALAGTGTRKLSTDQIMAMTRGER
jgi:antitoxin PrlF